MNQREQTDKHCEHCPFCGKPALLEEYDGKHGYDEFFNLGCSDDKCCGHQIFSCWKIDGQIEGAIAAWNRRIAPSSTERRFPIQGGPSVPWRVMVPHEAQARRNHDQDLETLARRGGLSAGEAWLAVGGLPMDMYTNAQWDGFAARWRDFADKVNGTFAPSATASASVPHDIIQRAIDVLSLANSWNAQAMAVALQAYIPKPGNAK